MILCPFCGSEMSDEARSCPSCRSVLVERKEAGRKRELPPALHPMVTFAVILVVSGALLAASIIRTSPQKTDGLDTPVNVAAANPAPTPPPEAAPPAEPPKALTPAAPANAGGDPREIYDKFIAYETKVKDVLAQIDKLAEEMEDLRRANTPESRQAMSEKLNSMRAVRQQLRAAEEPTSLKRAHTHISNSIDITMRGYRSFMIYMESGDLSKLDQGRKDLNKAQKYRGQALEEIAGQKSKLTPPPPPPSPPEPTPPPAVQPPAATPPSEKPPKTPPANPPGMFPPGYQPLPGEPYNDQPEPEPEPAPLEGDSAYYHDDGQPYPQDGESPPPEYSDDQLNEQGEVIDNGEYIENPD